MSTPHRRPRTRPTALRRLSLALAAGAVLGLAPGCSSDGPKIDPEVQRQMHEEAAYNHYKAGSLDRAIDQAQRALAIEEDDVDMIVLVAKCYTRMGSIDDLLEAERIYIGLEKKHSDENPVILGTAIVSERLAQANMVKADEIEAGLDVPIGKDPQKEIERHRAEQARLFARAEDRYRTLLERQPEYIEALNGLTRVCSLTGRYDEALQFVGTLVNVLEKQDTFYDQRLRQEVLTETDEKGFRKLLRTTRTLLIDAHQVAADLHFQQGRSNLALGHLDKAIELDPKNSPELYALRAQVLLALGRPARAIADLDRFIGASPLPIEHPDVRAAYRMRADAQRALASQGS